MMPAPKPRTPMRRPCPQADLSAIHGDAVVRPLPEA